MPRVVDHRERRREVALATADLISKIGVEAVTIRAIADHLGYSTAIVQHYFPNKRQLLLYTHRLLASFVEQQLRAVQALDAADIVGILRPLLPMTARSRQRWQMWVAYRATAMVDHEYAMEHRRLLYAVREIIERCLLARLARDGVTPPTDVKAAARRILALVHGIGVEALFDAEDWPPAQQLAVAVSDVRDLTGLDLSPDEGHEIAPNVSTLAS